MALQKSYIYKGFTYPESYNVIGDVRYNKLNNYIRGILLTYANSGSRAENINNYLGEQRVRFESTGSFDHRVIGDVTEACYTYLKTLPEWSGSASIDV
jgi:hypothetical protein